MEITQNILQSAQKTLQFEGVQNLPKQIGDSAFYLAAASDNTILGHGSIRFKGIEYKIGTQKQILN